LTHAHGCSVLCCPLWAPVWGFALPHGLLVSFCLHCFFSPSTGGSRSPVLFMVGLVFLSRILRLFATIPHSPWSFPYSLLQVRPLSVLCHSSFAFFSHRLLYLPKLRVPVCEPFFFCFSLAGPLYFCRPLAPSYFPRTRSPPCDPMVSHGFEFVTELGDLTSGGLTTKMLCVRSISFMVR